MKKRRNIQALLLLIALKPGASSRSLRKALPLKLLKGNHLGSKLTLFANRSIMGAFCLFLRLLRLIERKTCFILLARCRCKLLIKRTSLFQGSVISLRGLVKRFLQAIHALIEQARTTLRHVKLFLRTRVVVANRLLFFFRFATQTLMREHIALKCGKLQSSCRMFALKFVYA